MDISCQDFSMIGVSRSASLRYHFWQHASGTPGRDVDLGESQVTLGIQRLHFRWRRWFWRPLDALDWLCWKWAKRNSKALKWVLQLSHCILIRIHNSYNFINMYNTSWYYLIPHMKTIATTLRISWYHTVWNLSQDASPPYKQQIGAPDMMLCAETSWNKYIIVHPLTMNIHWGSSDLSASWGCHHDNSGSPAGLEFSQVIVVHSLRGQLNSVQGKGRPGDQKQLPIQDNSIVSFRFNQFAHMLFSSTAHISIEAETHGNLPACGTPVTRLQHCLLSAFTFWFPKVLTNLTRKYRSC